MIYLDTDVLSYFLSGNEQIYAMLKGALNNGEKIALTILTVYEILKGLRYRQSIQKEQEFQRVLDCVQVDHLSNNSIALAASIYGNLRRKGITISDADILIAAIVQEHGGILATNNQKHFRHIDGLQWQLWQP
ncbi:hypothetical protein FACS189419_02720 [Planctomycetales bacterium]|nr:hypothetical protein FACS189419_02720 [Planctomycetales bacterium]